MLKGKNLIEPMDLTVEELEELFETAEDIIENLQSALEGFQVLQAKLKKHS